MTKSITKADEAIIDKIYLISGQKVILDEDLAELYGVATKVLNQSVKRNLFRFPRDFMFQLSAQDLSNLKSQIVTSSLSAQGQAARRQAGWGGRRKRPYAITEQGVAMLSSVLNSERAILVNIHIIRVFTRIRQMLSTHKDILLKLETLERKVTDHDGDIKLIFEYLKELLNPKTEPVRKIGFRHKKEDQP
jgi:hypothetical protein